MSVAQHSNVLVKNVENSVNTEGTERLPGNTEPSLRNQEGVEAIPQGSRGKRPEVQRLRQRSMRWSDLM